MKSSSNWKPSCNRPPARPVISSRREGIPKSASRFSTGRLMENDVRQALLRATAEDLIR